MLGAHQLSQFIEQGSASGGFTGATSLLITVSVNMLIDGLLIGVAFLNVPKTGVIIAVALAVKTLFLGVAAVAILPDRLPVVKNWPFRSSLAV